MKSVVLPGSNRAAWNAREREQRQRKGHSISGYFEIVVENRSGFEIDKSRIETLAQLVLARVGFPGGELGISYVTVEEISELNRQHMDRQGPTDVLSFPLDDRGHLAGEGPVPVLFGDVVICPLIATKQGLPIRRTP